MHLVLDTNVLHQEHLASINMKTLFRLVESGYVTVCVPTLVRREYVTKVINECTARLQAANSNVDNVLKITKVSAMYPRTAELQNALAQLRSEIAANYNDDYRTWAESYRVREIEFDPTSINSVMDDYFSGASPFKGPKSREDIVDSMISKCVDSLLSQVGSVGIVVKDGALKRHFEQQGRVQVFDGLDDFLSSKATDNELARLNIQADVQAMMAALSDRAAVHALEQFVRTNQGVLDSIYLEADEVSGRESLEIPCFGVRVNGPRTADVTSLTLGHLEYAGQTQFAFAFEMEAETRVDFCANYRDYLELSYDREKAIDMTSMDGDGICDLEEKRHVLIAGKLVVDVGPDTTAMEIKEQIGGGDFRAFTLEFEATSARLTR